VKWDNILVGKYKEKININGLFHLKDVTPLPYPDIPEEFLT
jgi:hypothetical protein